MGLSRFQYNIVLIVEIHLQINKFINFQIGTMNIEGLRQYCLSKNFASESFPFDKTTLVFKVSDKMFALVDLNDNPPCVNLKCEPARAIELREKYPCVTPGYHMNKKHWNTVVLDNTVSDACVCQWIDDSYHLVVDSLPKKQSPLRNR